MDITSNKTDFINTMIEFASSVEESLKNAPEIDRYRKEDGKYSRERFRSFFIKKAAVHIICKYILIRIAEDGGNLKSKLNTEGIQKWREMSKNLKDEYIILFQIACDDIRRDERYQGIFTETEYDTLTVYTRYIINPKYTTNGDMGFLERLRDYDFKTIDASTVMTIIESIYPEDDRKNLQSFYEPSPVINQLLTMVGLK